MWLERPEDGWCCVPMWGATREGTHLRLGVLIADDDTVLEDQAITRREWEQLQ